MNKVSVIIPVFNGIRFIADAIKSVQAQTFRDLDIVVVDDGSTDGTEAAVKEMACDDDRIRYFKKNNGGVSSARNLGLVHAAGEYISFLDCDDSYEPAFIERCLDTIQDSDYCVCWARINIFGRTKYYRPRETKDELIDFMKFRTRIRINGILVKKELLDRFGIRFDDSRVKGEDHDFLYQIVAVGKSSYVSEVLCTYNFVENSLSGREHIPSVDNKPSELFPPSLENWFIENKESLKTSVEAVFAERRRLKGSWAIREFWRHVYFSGRLTGEEEAYYRNKMEWYGFDRTLKGVVMTFMKCMSYMPGPFRKPIARAFKALGLSGH